MIYHLHFDALDQAIAALAAVGLAQAGAAALPGWAQIGDSRVDIMLAGGTGTVLAPTGKMIAPAAVPGMDAPPPIAEMAALPGIYLTVSGPDGLQFPPANLVTGDAVEIAPVPALPRPSHIISALEFMSLFSPAEQVAIFASSDPHVTQFRWMAAAAGELDLSGSVVNGALRALVQLGLLTADRAAQIEAGQK